MAPRVDMHDAHTPSIEQRHPIIRPSSAVFQSYIENASTVLTGRLAGGLAWGDDRLAFLPRAIVSRRSIPARIVAAMLGHRPWLGLCDHWRAG
jgi:hypothetical protein